MSRIHKDHNGVVVHALGDAASPRYAYGHDYSVTHQDSSGLNVLLQFQQGPVKEAGVNGITNEALLAVLAHRIEYLDTKIPCKENEAALYYINAAATCLQARTLSRIALGVEGEAKA